MGLISSPLFLVLEKYGIRQRVGKIVSRENTVNLLGNVEREEEFSNVVFPGRMIILLFTQTQTHLFTGKDWINTERSVKH